MYSKTERELLKKILDKYGAEKQFEMLIEEMAEATVEIQHFKRGKENLFAVTEELIDIHIVLTQLLTLFSESSKKAIIKQKLDREAKRIVTHKSSN